METADGHCGYEFSWSPYRLLPLSGMNFFLDFKSFIKGSSIYHNFHHSHNVGNYGSFFTLWDTLCGTNRHFFKYLANKEKKQLAALIQPEFNKINKNEKVQALSPKNSQRNLKAFDSYNSNS